VKAFSLADVSFGFIPKIRIKKHINMKRQNGFVETQDFAPL